MESIWYAFINEYKDRLPYKPLSVILESFWWYCTKTDSDDLVYKESCQTHISKLMN